MREVVPLEVVPMRFQGQLRLDAAQRDARRGGGSGEARPVLDYLAREKLDLAAILATHHHPDHVGGIAQLLEKFRVPVYGPSNEPIATLTGRFPRATR